MNNKSYRIAFVVQGCIIIMLACISLFLRNEISSKDILIRQQELKLIDYALGISPSSVERLPVPAKPSTTMILNSNNNNNNNNNNAKSVSNLPSMHDLGMKTGTDKVTHHGYDRYYPMYLENLRTKPINMLEIGFLLGQSFEMWKLYFPLGNIYFMDKDCAKSHPKSRFCGDQGKVQDLQKMLSTKNITGNLDFIIDDGSHHPVHQIVSFTYLFEHGLKPGTTITTFRFIRVSVEIILFISLNRRYLYHRRHRNELLGEG